MKKCSVCGESMPDIARFCGYCGSPLASEVSLAIPSVERKIDLGTPPPMPSGEGIGATEELLPDSKGLVAEELTPIEPEAAVATEVGTGIVNSEASAMVATTEQVEQTEKITITDVRVETVTAMDPYDEILQSENVDVPDTETIKNAMEKLVEFSKKPATPEEIISQLRYVRATIMKKLPYNPLYHELKEWIKAFEQFPKGVPIDEENHKLLMNAALLWADRVGDVPAQ
ncbi:MAG: zinc ribbon domain-containing protein [Candidatus Korarchaeota archaeon]